MAEMKSPMVVRRRFKVQDGVGLRWAEPLEVLETDGWRNAASLERGGYLRKLEFGESVERQGHRLIVSKGAGAQVAGRERASSFQSPDPVTPAPSSEEEESDGGEEVEVEIAHVGGGWYNVLIDGKVSNASPIQGKSAAQEWADGHS